MAEDVISNLKIVATAESRGVETSLGAIAASLEKLKTSVSAETANNIRKTGTAIADLARNIKIISLSDVSKMERLADALGRIKGYGSITRTVKVRYKEDTSSLPGGTSEGGAAMPGSSTISTDISPYLEGAERGAYMRSNGMYEGERAMRSVGNKVKLFQGKLLSSIGRIAFYRMIRSAIMAVTKAFSEGYENAKKWAELNDSRLYDSVMRVKAAYSEMENQLGAAGLELTNAIAPALIKLAGVVTNIADRMSEFFATLDTKNDGTYLKAKKVTKEMMKQTEELKRQILGFDEINKLNGNNTSSLTEDDLFEKAPIDKSRATLTTVIVGAISMALGIKAGFDLLNWLTKIEVAIVSLKASTDVGNAFKEGGVFANILAGVSSVGGYVGAIAAGIAAMVAALAWLTVEYEIPWMKQWDKYRENHPEMFYEDGSLVPESDRQRRAMELEERRRAAEEAERERIKLEAFEDAYRSLNPLPEIGIPDGDVAAPKNYKDLIGRIAIPDATNPGLNISSNGNKDAAAGIEVDVSIDGEAIANWSKKQALRYAGFDY